MTKIYSQGNYIVIEANNERNTFPKRDVRFKVVDEDGIYSLSSQELPIGDFNYSEVKKEEGSDYTTALEFETFLFENTGNFNSGADVSPNVIGSIKITDTAPTAQGLYILSDVGTYTNLGGLVTTAGKLNYAYFNGTTWSMVKVDIQSSMYDYLMGKGIEPQVTTYVGQVFEDFPEGIIAANTGNVIYISPANRYAVINFNAGYDFIKFENFNFTGGYVFFDVNGTRISNGTIVNGAKVNVPTNARSIKYNLKYGSTPLNDLNLIKITLFNEMGLSETIKYFIDNAIEVKSYVDNNNIELKSYVDNSISEGISDYITSNELSNYPLIRIHDFYNAGKTDSQIIDDALSFSANLSKRVLLFDTKQWNIDKAILLKANTIVLIDGVKIKQNNYVFDNVFRSDNLTIDSANPNGYVTSSSVIENIKILGFNDAIIEGPEINATKTHPTQGSQLAVGDFWGWRTIQIYLPKVDGIEIKNLSMAKTRCWAIVFEKSKNIYVGNITFNNINVKNGDGIDFRFGCKNFLVENIYGYTLDDTVAMTAINYNIVNSSYVYPMEATANENAGLPISDLYIENGIVRNIYTTGVYHAVIVLSASGYKVQNILITDVIEPKSSSRTTSVEIYTGYGTGTYTTGDINNIKVNNVDSKSTNGVKVSAKVSDVWLNKIKAVTNNTVVTNNSGGVTVTNS